MSVIDRHRDEQTDARTATEPHQDLRRPRRESRRPRRDSRPREILHALGLGLSAGILAIVVGIAVLVIIIPRATGAVPLTVLTQSMEPHFPPGTLLVVHKVPIDDIRIGDVVTYEPNPNDPTVISHRVIAITAESDGTKIFTVKGDNNAEADAPVQAKQIQAVLWYAVPWLGWVNSAVGSSEHSWVIPLAAGALLLYAGYLFVAHFVQRARASRRAAE